MVPDDGTAQTPERRSSEPEGSQETQFPVKEGNKSPPGWSKHNGPGKGLTHVQNEANNNVEERER
jgi:hypothetical protein